MGGIFSKARNLILGPRNTSTDINVPPPPYGLDPYDPGFGPPYATGFGRGGFGGLDPYGSYGYGPGFPTDPIGGYGPEFGDYPSGMSPLNYGNYYLGNTTMQMLPMMQRKLAKFAQRQALGGGFGGGFGGGGFGGGFGGGGFPMMPMMPMMPCMPPSCGMSMAAPMMAAATPLPMTYNPIVQNFYSPSAMPSFNWMNPATFMSALSSGPSYFQPPASFQFPSNVGMIMNIPSAMTNPLMAMPTFGGFTPQYGVGGGMSCCCCYCTPQVSAPTITYYPRPVSVPQPCPVPCPVPVPIPNIQRVPVPRPVTVVAPPIVAGGGGFGGFGGLSAPIPTGAPLMPFQGALTQGALGTTTVMKSNSKSTKSSIDNDEETQSLSDKQNVSTSIVDLRRAKAQRIAASLSNLGLSTPVRKEFHTNKAKHRMRPNHRHGSRNNTTFLPLRNDEYSSDLDRLTSDKLSLVRKSHGKSSNYSRTRRRRSCSTSDDDCIACTRERRHNFAY